MSLFKINPATVKALSSVQLDTLIQVAQNTNTSFWKRALAVLRDEKARRG